MKKMKTSTVLLLVSVVCGCSPNNAQETPKSTAEANQNALREHDWNRAFSFVSENSKATKIDLLLIVVSKELGEEIAPREAFDQILRRHGIDGKNELDATWQQERLPGQDIEDKPAMYALLMDWLKTHSKYNGHFALHTESFVKEEPYDANADTAWVSFVHLASSITTRQQLVKIGDKWYFD